MPPSSNALHHLLLSEELCPENFLSGWKRQRDLEEEEEELLQACRASSSSLAADHVATRKQRKKDTSAKMFVIDRDSGEPREGTPHDSLWWVNYVMYPHLMTPRMHHKFRRRFHMPFKTWQELVEKLNTEEIFAPWHHGAKNCFGTASSSLQLLSLGALRYLGRKCTFDCLEELTFISERTHERFFAKFIEYGATNLYTEYVVAPQTAEEAQSHMYEMGLAGFNGALGSMDATHVTIENCRFGLRQIHLGHKLSKTARTYNIIVNHRRRILSSTGGHPSRWNDKTIVQFDSFLEDIKTGKSLADTEFELFEHTSDGTIVKVTYRGPWILVDNRYLEWSITIPPFKYCGDRKDMRWSQWMESMRKDVECTFGILKKRFTILSKGVQAKDIGNADKVWKTCCALHNMLLEVDGHDEMWKDKVSIDDQSSSCFAIGRLFDGDEDRVVTVEEQSDDTDSPEHSGTVRDVRSMTFDEMRSRLVEHFDIQFRRGKIVWPRRVTPPRSV